MIMTLQELEQVKKDLANGIIVSRSQWVKVLDAAIEGKTSFPTWKSLTDVQWMNIVNHEHAYFGWDMEEAIHHSVKATEAKCKEVNAPNKANQQDSK